MTMLPKFKGYTVDARLKQFRKITEKENVYICFDSVTGYKLLTEYIKTLNPDSVEFNQIAEAIL